MEPIYFGRATVSEAYLSFLSTNVRPEDRAALRAAVEGPSAEADEIAQLRRVKAQLDASRDLGIAAMAEHEQRKQREQEDDKAAGSSLRMTLLKAHGLVRQLKALRGEP